MAIEVDLTGKAILVVGASSGIGRAMPAVLCEAGARVVAAARRMDRLEALASEVEGTVLPVRCDVVDEASCSAAVAATVEAFGSLDALVYTSGVAVFQPVATATAEQWRRVFDVNVVGPSILTRAALPHLKAAGGSAIYLSSISADESPPRRGLGLYATSKAGMDKLIEVWQDEHRDVSFARINVGDTGDTEMAADWDMEAAAGVIQEWSEKGFLFGRTMEGDTVARYVAALIACPENVGVSRLTPRHAVS